MLARSDSFGRIMAGSDNDSLQVLQSDSSDSDLSLPLEDLSDDDPEVESLNRDSDHETAAATAGASSAAVLAGMADLLKGVVRGTPFEDQSKQEALMQLRIELQQKDWEQVNLWLFNHLRTHSAPLHFLLGGEGEVGQEVVSIGGSCS